MLAGAKFQISRGFARKVPARLLIALTYLTLTIGVATMTYRVSLSHLVNIVSNLFY